MTPTAFAYKNEYSHSSQYEISNQLPPAPIQPIFRPSFEANDKQVATIYQNWVRLNDSIPPPEAMFHDFLEVDYSKFYDSSLEFDPHPTESTDIFSSQELDDLFTSLTKVAAGCGTSDCGDDALGREFQDDGICELLLDVNKRKEMENVDKLADAFDSFTIV
ncbi:1925_t:CDS:2 [Ambispora gerdemannii]|uniref:1925_t:CDS:1 n=1 Tax=Ambispora gerdemannii TaxID=144530 RepID=A0A9N9BF19_9GLOM|nr:1925_t:CDS:2 [Ambispora gerdemannii]